MHLLAGTFFHFDIPSPGFRENARSMDLAACLSCRLLGIEIYVYLLDQVHQHTLYTQLGLVASEAVHRQQLSRHIVQAAHQC